MLTAMLLGIKVFARDVTAKNMMYRCPFCDERVVLVKPEANIVDHFRHHSKACRYQGEPETNEHLKGKQYLYNFFREIGESLHHQYEYDVIEDIGIHSFYDMNRPDPKIDIEVKLSNGRIADVLLTLFRPTIERLAIEFQCSPISLREFKERNADYEKLGVDVLWIFGTKKYFRYHTDFIGRFVNLSDVEKESSIIYDGYVFYLNTDLIDQPIFSPLLGIKYQKSGYVRKKVIKEMAEFGWGFIERKFKQKGDIIEVCNFF